MPKHEFGIMKQAPVKGKRYDKYEPDKYSCISIDDTFVEEVLEQLCEIDFYWHTLEVQGKGLAYAGITLIPPESMPSFIAVLDDRAELFELKHLLSQASTERNYVIHFGI